MTMKFKRQDDQGVIELDNVRVTLSNEQLVSVVSALTTPGIQFQVDLTYAADETEAPAPASSSSPPSPGNVIPRMGHIRDSLDVEVPFHVANPKVARQQDERRPHTTGDLTFTRSAIAWADRLGMTNDIILNILNDPTDEWISNDGKVAIVVRGNLALEVAIDNDQILGAFRAHEAMQRFPRESTISDNRHFSGGRGNDYPNDIRSLIKRLRGLGLHVEYRPSGHYLVKNERGSCTLPSSPSDHRSIINCVKAVERNLGVNLRAH